jgi:hypothetical protein
VLLFLLGGLILFSYVQLWVGRETGENRFARNHFQKESHLQRWTAKALLVAEKRFRKVRGHQSMAAMIDSLNSTAVQMWHDVYSEGPRFSLHGISRRSGQPPFALLATPPISTRRVESSIKKRTINRFLPVPGEFIKSGRDRCLVEAATVFPPSVRH